MDKEQLLTIQLDEFCWDEYHEWLQLVYGCQHLNKDVAYKVVIANRRQSILGLIKSSNDGINVYKKVY